MPKKRSYNFKPLHGSSSKQGNSSNGADKKTSTVNERLGELRKLEAKDAAQKKRELAEAVTQRSVPPQLRPILGVSESAPPKPKRGIRLRTPTNRTPGPAPPRSWQTPLWTSPLAIRGQQRRVSQSGSADHEYRGSRANELLRFFRMTGVDTAQPSGLLHLSLKVTAQHWALFDEEDLPALAELPLRLRLRLVCYLGIYGPSIAANVLEALLRGTEQVQHLDLANLIGHGGLTLARLIKYVKQQTALLEDADKAEGTLNSWEDESFEDALTLREPISRFSQLSHLGLSHPPIEVSWKDLLALSRQLPSITHLSLAYWPRPTLTPNLATTTVTSQHSPDVDAGASNYYSGIDSDFLEPASLLRQLSSHLLRLQWLDIEGCTEWMPALAAQGLDETGALFTNPEASNTWTRVMPVTALFAQNWRNLEYLNCFQGWLPDIHAVRTLPRQSMTPARREIVDDFLEVVDPLPLSSVDTREDLYQVEKRKAEMWLQVEEKAAAAQKTISAVRRAHGCRYVTIDHGWDRLVELE